jgi:hypothetical protein
MPKGVMPSETVVGELMAPGDSELETEGHEEDCWNCNGTGTYEAKGASGPCGECDGTGIILSTSNCNAWWDWYVIGGRWNGVLTDNTSREVDVYRNDLENNTCRVADIVLTPERYPHTIVTPDGEMHINEDVSYAAKPSWMDEARAVLWRYAEHYCVVVDYHM